ncbi:hypothetical protein J4421_00255 [Candidatus Woesearchaeota archaeon]|nr:hypothetical protein [Candidatus Woesearchaeota archaeon]
MTSLLESLQESACGYCHKEINSQNVYSSWSETEQQHYKNVHCHNCQKKIWVKVPFLGSGHDSFAKKNDLEKKI